FQVGSRLGPRLRRARSVRRESDERAAGAGELLRADPTSILSDVRIRLELAVLFLIVAIPASAQRGPQLEVSVLAANSPPAGASVRVSRLLQDRQTRELLLNGFPAALRFRLALWRAGRLFDDLERTTQWEVHVRYDP